jgi:hypothetical protein
MQNKLTIALVAATFALASYPAFAADMPVDGTKNFTAPGDAPSYFTNETAPASARVANQATFTEDEVPAPEVGQPATDRGGKHASARRSTKHASGKSKGSGGSAHYTKAPSSKSTRGEVVHTSGTRSASAAKGSGKSGTPAAAGKVNTTKHAKSSIRQQAAAVPRTPAAASFA